MRLMSACSRAGAAAAAALARRDRLGARQSVFLAACRARSRWRFSRSLPVTLPPLIAWATTRAVWSAPDGALCRAHQDGACWAFIAQKFDYLRYGSYPVARALARRCGGGRRRGADRLAAVAARAASRPRRGLVLPRLSDPRLRPAARRREPRPAGRRHAAVGRHFRFAADGAGRHRLLAAARRAAGAGAALAPAVVKAASVVFIEFVRGVPFIAVLFMANNMLPLFLPAGWAPDRFVPPLVGTALFAAAYHGRRGARRPAIARQAASSRARWRSASAIGA